MNLTAQGLWLYSGALVILWITPGPVFVALTARALSGGFRSAWPLAFGVALGDILWPLAAIFGLAFLVSQFDMLMAAMRYVAAAIFLIMGGLLYAHAERPVSPDRRLTRPGLWAGFSAGVAAIIGNPKAILFYMGVLPGFFDLGQVGATDIGVILALSAAIPLAGNLVTAGAVAGLRQRITSAATLARINRVAGGLLIAVGLVIPFT